MNKIQIRVVDPTHGKVLTKTFEGPTYLQDAIAFLNKLNAA